MDSASLPSLTPLLDGIDRWVELAPLLPVIIAFELILSADNAVALAAITRRLSNIEQQRRALNYGIVIAFIFRIILILLAKWILYYWQFQLIASLYLLSLFFNKLIDKYSRNDIKESQSDSNLSNSFISTVFLLSLTDLAFSIDSVAAAVAISDQVLLVITGAMIGVLSLRFTSGLFIKWLEIYPRLELAGYIAVGLVGVKLLLNISFSNIFISEWLILLLVSLLFIWGFSTKIGD